MIGRIAARLRRCERGATLVEFAFASPILIMLLIGAVQIGQMLHASAGIRHALGEAARWTRVRYDSDNVAANRAAIEQEVRNNYLGINRLQVRTLTAEPGTRNGVAIVTLRLVYEFDPEFILFDVAPFEMEATRIVYLQN